MKTNLLFLYFLFAGVAALRSAPEVPTPPAKQMRLVFRAYDGIPQMTNRYDKFSFEVYTVDISQPSKLLRLGEMIPNTGLKLLKFVFKETRNENLGENDDVSELVVQNPVTGKTATLFYNKVVDVSAIAAPPRQSKETAK